MKLLKTIFAIIGWSIAACFALSFLFLIVVIIGVARKGLSEDDMSGQRVKSDHAVGVVELTGEILSSEKFEKALKQAVENTKLKAIVVRVDSPGGAVGASEEMYRAIKAADEKKPVVCSMGSVAASGGLFASLGCRKIVANDSTLTGSIGVIMMMPNVRTIMDRYGVGMNVVKSGKFKDSGSPFRDFTPEDQTLVQALVNEAFDQFVRLIAASRRLPEETVRKFADGRIILGAQAVQLGLVDEIGSLTHAAKVALSLSGDASDPEVVMPQKPAGIFSLVSNATETLAPSWLRMGSRAQLLYESFL